MTLQRLWAVLSVALPVLGALVATLSSVDLAYQLRAGAEILDGLGIPRVDRWTYTVAGQPWHDQQWGAQVVLASVERIGGWTGLALIRAVLVGTTFGLIALAAVRRGASVRSASLLALAAFLVASVALGLRPQLFGILLFAITLVLVGERHRHPRLLWLAVPLTVLWANLHGSFFLAPVLLGSAWLEDVVARRGHVVLAVAVAAVVATLLNPWGVDIWRYALGLTVDANVRERVTEWQPTLPTDVPGLLFYASAFAVGLLLARRRPLPSWPVLLTLAGFFALGVVTGRGIAWWPLVAAVVVAGLVGEGASNGPAAPRPEPEGLRRLNALVVAGLVVASIAALPVWRPAEPGSGVPAGLLTEAPPGVTAALRDVVEPGDRLFAPQVWGSWLEYRFPQATVGADSRIELYPAAVWEAVAGIVVGDAPWWPTQLDHWDIRIVVTAPSEGAFRERLQGLGWRVAYAGTDGAVLVRSDRIG